MFAVAACVAITLAFFCGFVHCRLYSRDESFIGYSEVFLNLPKHKHAPIKDEFLVFSTEFGNITIRLFPQHAPKAVGYMKSLVDQKLLDGCSFYRAEPPGETVDEIHPSVVRIGYALIQGGLNACGKQKSVALPVESALSNKKGTVSLIVGTSEFFINLEDHLEWNGSFTVWGQVIGKTSWLVAEKILSLPTHQELHPSGTVLRLLEKAVSYSVSHKVGDAL